MEEYGKTGLQHKIRTKYLGQVIHFVDSLSSTNDYAKSLALKGAVAGTLVAADSQTAGRGSGNRTWLSPPHTGVYFSFVLTPSFPPRRAQEVTVLTAYSITMSLREKYKVPVLLKWPNDILLNSKKIGGVLAEGSVVEDAIKCMVIGVGINVNMTQFPQELQDKASSLCLECGYSFDRTDLVADFLHQFEQEYDQYIVEGSLDHIIPAYDALLIHRDQRIRLIEKKSETIVISKGINRFGELRIQEPDGSMRDVGIGEVSIRGIPGYGSL